MKTQIKIRKVTIGKILFGIMLTICLTAATAFGQEEQTKSKKSEQPQEKVYDVVEQKPEFTGGQTEFAKYFKESVQYPEEAKKKGIQGKVFVNFIVGADGSISNARVLQAVDPMLDAEALRVVTNMPKWVPGKEKGKEVAVYYNLPVNFTLN